MSSNRILCSLASWRRCANSLMSLPAQNARASPPCRIRQRTSWSRGDFVERCVERAQHRPCVTRLSGPLSSADLRDRAVNRSARRARRSQHPQLASHVVIVLSCRSSAGASMPCSTPRRSKCRWMRSTYAPNSGTSPSTIGRGRGSSTRISSTTSPGLGLMTRMRSDSPTASSTLCVMNSTVGRRRSQSASRSVRTCRRVSASSAPNGSSIRSSDGSCTSVRISDTRWRMPPESCRGYLSIACVRRSCANSSFARASICLRRQLADVRVQHHVVERGAELEQQMVLERDADVGDRLRHRTAADRRCRRGCGLSSPATISISVLLPHPDGPTTETNSPASMSTLTSFSARNGLSVSSPKIFDTRLIRIGTPHFAPLRVVMRPRHASRRRARRRDGGKRHLRHEQRLASALHDPVVLVDDLDVEDRDRLRRPRLAVAQLGDPVVHEDRVADEDRARRTSSR